MINGSYQVQRITSIKSYLRLGMHTSKESSARGTVSTATWPQTTSNMASEENMLGDFDIFWRIGDMLFLPWKRNYSHRVISLPWGIPKEGI